MLNGTVSDLVLSPADGSYSFPDLPADGSYLLNALDGADLFTPPEQDVSLLFDDASGLDFTLLAPTAADVSVSGRVVDPYGRGVSRAIVSLTDGAGRTKTSPTNTFGYFQISGIRAGSACILSVASRRMTFPPLFLLLEDNVTGIVIEGHDPAVEQFRP